MNSIYIKMDSGPYICIVCGAVVQVLQCRNVLYLRPLLSLKAVSFYYVQLYESIIIVDRIILWMWVIDIWRYSVA